MADIKGMFRVNKNNMFTPNIQYAVCFTNDRLLFIKIGGEFADGGKAVAGAAFGGILGWIIGARMDKNQTKNDNQKGPIIQRLREMSNEELMSLDTHNFEVRYEVISKVTLSSESTYNLAYMKPRCGILTLKILEQKPKIFDISARDSIEDCRNTLLKLLPNKVQ